MEPTFTRHEHKHYMQSQAIVHCAERGIDQPVYQLSGLSDEEIQIVEEATA
jgi:hypothetical protein